MAEHNVKLLFAIVTSVVSFIITMVFTGLAAPGKYPFTRTTKNISDEFTTEITPSRWTFYIWPLIYAFLGASLVYILSGIFRKNAHGYVYCSPAVLSYGFFASWCVNLGLNVGWLFIWYNRLMVAAAIFLFLIVFANYATLFYCCQGLHKYGAWLNKHHTRELWIIRMLVQNGIATYATWTTIACLINLTIVMTSQANVAETTSATISLSLLAVVLSVWFFLENKVFEKHVRYILTVYPTVIWALTGVYTKNYDPAAPSRNAIFVVGLLCAACAMFPLRLVLTYRRHNRDPLYKDEDPDVMSPMEKAEQKKNMFETAA